MNYIYNTLVKLLNQYHPSLMPVIKERTYTIIRIVVFALQIEMIM